MAPDRSELRAVSSAERTLDARALASMRPAVQPAPRQRKTTQPALREVTSGIVCFCGERFGESQALEFMLHLRAEVGEELSFAEYVRTYRRTWNREYRKRPEVRAKLRERQRLYNSTPERKERRKARSRGYYQANKEAVKARTRERKIASRHAEGKLTQEEIRETVCDLARRDGTVTADDLVRGLGVSTQAARQRLSRMSADGTLERISRGVYALGASGS